MSSDSNREEASSDSSTSTFGKKDMGKSPQKGDKKSPRVRSSRMKNDTAVARAPRRRQNESSAGRPMLPYANDPYVVAPKPNPNQQFEPSSQRQQIPHQQMFPHQQALYPPSQTMTQGGYVGHYPTRPFPSQPPHPDATMNGNGYRRARTPAELQLSRSASAMISTAHAAIDSFLASNDEASESDSTTNKSKRHGKGKNSDEQETKLVIEIRKNAKGAIIGSNINIETVSEPQSKSDIELEIEDDPPRKKRKRKKKEKTESTSEEEPEVIRKEQQPKKVKSNSGGGGGGDDDGELEAILGPKPSLNDLENYVRELFKEDIERKKDEVIESEEGALSLEEKLAKAKQHLPKGNIDQHYRTKVWEDNFYKLLKYVAIHKTWWIKPNNSNYASARNWYNEQKYRYRNTFTGAFRKAGKNGPNNNDTPRDVVLTQENYERFYNVGLPFPPMVAEEGKTLVSFLVLKPPFPPRSS